MGSFPLDVDVGKKRFFFLGQECVRKRGLFFSKGRGRVKECGWKRGRRLG